MNEQIVEQPTEQPTLTGTTSEAVETEQAEPLSIADHAKQFGPQAQTSETDEPTADDLKPIRPVDQQRRDQGKFAEGKQRLRAGDAVKRINELTGRAKTAEEKLAAAEAELTRLRTERASPSRIEAAEQRVDRAEQKVEQERPQAPRHPSGYPEPEPQEDDPKFGGDYAKYLRGVAAWEARFQNWQFRQWERQQASQAEQGEVWDDRIAAARTKYGRQEFDAAANRVFQRLPQESFVSAWIQEHELGEDVLYYFDQHPQELDAILRIPTVLKQSEAVTLLSQRFASKPSPQAGSTGSAAGRQIVLPPRPPNPVRTEAQRASDSPPPTDGSLSIAEHRKRFGPR